MKTDRRDDRARHDQLALALAVPEGPIATVEPPTSATREAPPGPADAILEGLTEEQLAAVTHGEGPLLIVAGAGTGKTAVITRRIAHLITTRRARPEEILALTFTDRAAAEMEERVDRLVPYGYTQAWISTFHAFGDRVLRENALHLGLSPDFRVLTKPEQIMCASGSSISPSS